MIIFGYYISTEMFGKFEVLTMVLVTPFLILFLTVVGAYLFFRSSVSIIFKSLKKSKHGRISITDVVFTSSIMHRMKKNAIITNNYCGNFSCDSNYSVFWRD